MEDRVSFVRPSCVLIYVPPAHRPDVIFDRVVFRLVSHQPVGRMFLPTLSRLDIFLLPTYPSTGCVFRSCCVLTGVPLTNRPDIFLFATPSIVLDLQYLASCPSHKLYVILDVFDVLCQKKKEKKK